MTMPPQPKQGLPTRPSEPPTIRGMLAFLGILAGLAVVLSYPLASAVALCAVAGTALGARYYLVNRSEADRARTRTLHIPGIGRLEYRITP